MSKSQKTVLAVGFGLFVVSLFFMPYHPKFESVDRCRLPIHPERAPFWNICTQDKRVDVRSLLWDWTAIAVLTGGALFFCRKSRSR